MTKKSTKTSEHTSTISVTRNIILTGVISLTTKKYASIKNMSDTIDHYGNDPKGPQAFMRALQTLQWPCGFKITGVKPYEGRMNPTQWLQAYATTARATGGDTSVMANYLPIMLMPTAMNWLTSLALDSIGSWDS